MRKNNSVLLIGGSGRSGTTILSNIFANHPEICNVPESRFLIDPDGILDFYLSSTLSWSPYHYDIRLARLVCFLRKLGSLSSSRKFNAFLEKASLGKLLNRKMTGKYANLELKSVCPKFDLLVDELEYSLTKFKFYGQWVGMSQFEQISINYNNPSIIELKRILGKFISDFILNVLQYQGVEYYLEKNTWNILWFDKILEFIPTAKLVHIYRDPRDVVASFSKQKWMPSDHVESAHIYLDLMQKWKLIKSSIENDKFYEVGLEQLIARPESTIRDICSFWDIPFDHKLLDIGLSKANSNRWKSEINKNHLIEIERILKPVLDEYNYS